MRAKLWAIAALLCGFICGAAAAQDLRLATTTSTENSGLLKVILPLFETRHGIKVRVIAVGTGKALKFGENGDVDVVLVHSRPSEDKFIASGFGVDRRDVMYNDFVLVGPPADPAGIRGRKDIGGAFAGIFGAQTTFISRGDDSGTHKKELELWAAAGIKPESRPGSFRYLSAGQGMGAALTMAGSLQAYTLSDRGTYAAYRSHTDLDILVAGVPALFNPYGIIAVNPGRYSTVNYEGAMKLIEWIASAEGSQTIAGFKVNGRQLFFPGVPGQ